MLFLYRLLINIIFLISPIIIVFRLLKKKESFKRFREKFCFFTQKRNDGKLLWFHGASVGELQSIVPLLEKLEKKKSIDKILITSNTLSSSKILEKLKFKKVIHQFFPIDTNFHSKKFLKYWKPSAVFFIDSEIWPNMYFNLAKNNIPIILLNGRITKKSFSKWKIFPYFSKQIFQIFSLCFSSSLETKKYLKKLGAKNVKFIGNLKFSQSEKENLEINQKFKKFIKGRRTWCASSTHQHEEKICGLIHKKLKKRFKNLLTIIIPRHIDRSDLIEKELNKLNLKTFRHESDGKLKKNIDVYIVDTYGKTKTFYSLCKNIFLGGSLVNHGGQNPLEATRYGCKVLHGPNVSNFKEIYSFLKKNNISQKVYNEKDMIKYLIKLFFKKSNSMKIQKKLNNIGQKILQNTYKEIKLALKNEI